MKKISNQITYQQRLKKEYDRQIKVKKEIQQISSAVKKIKLLYKEGKNKSKEGNVEDLLKNI